MTDFDHAQGGGDAPPPAPLPTWASAPPAPRIATPSDTLPAPRREYVESLGRVGWYLAVGLFCGVAALLTQLLPDWEAGRWWMITVGLGAVAVLCGLLAVVFSVSAFGEVLRHSRAVKGAGVAVLTLVPGSVLLVGASVRLAADWDTLDVPAAWERVDLSPEKNRLVDAIDESRDVTAAAGESVRTRGRIGGCYTGDASDPGDEVECDEAHRLELVVAIQMTNASGDFAGDEKLADDAASLCALRISETIDRDFTGLDVRALVPNEVEWDAGDRQAMCVVVFPEPIYERFTG